MNATRSVIRVIIRLGVLLIAVPVVAVAIPASAAKQPSPPDTVIDSGPASVTNAAGVTFSFHSTVSGSSFTCRLDSGTATTCTSPQTYPGVAQGSHTFTVYATANGLNDGSPASWKWTADLTAPAAPTNLTATAPSQTSVKLTWSASTDSGGSGVTGYTVIRDGSALANLGVVTTYTDGAVTAGSTHAYNIQARDGAGNVSGQSNTAFATTPTPGPTPDTVIDSRPTAYAASTSATFTFHSTVTPASFTCRLDTGVATSCTSPKTYTGLTQGGHAVTVTATSGGATDPTPTVASWTVDTVAPIAPTGVAASASVNSVALAWAASTDATGVTGYDVYRDGTLAGSVGAVTGYTDTGVSTGTPYLYVVRARDAAGNTSANSATVSAMPSGAYDVHLTRAPYLTDLVGLNVTVNFATDRSGTAASVRYGSVVSGSCVPDSTPVTATRITVAVGATYEFQWKATLTLPAAGTYCYRPYLGQVDLLATNPSPQFQTQVPVGLTQGYTFAVFGDWGQVDANGTNQNQANLMAEIAKSGARFIVSTGDNGYPAGSQQNYGDLQQTGPDTSAIFGPSFWPVVGKSVPMFASIGNHGLARSDAVHPHLANWPADVAVTTSGGRYQRDTYPSVNGSAVADYPSPWYAFDAGGARFYILDAAWADLNASPGNGTGTAYQNEAASHWTATSPEYQWLKADLAAHPSGLKFAFFHYPMYSDQPSEDSDTSLQGSTSLQGLLTTYKVNMAFSGHAHIYQRTSSGGNPSIVYYTTGGGGAQAQSTGTCAGTDQYAVGWSYTNGVGTACGAAPAPTSDAQVYHFLKVTVNGSSVTVTPTDSTGRTFDVRTYTFTTLPDTFVDSAPPAGTTSASATFTFHASGANATYTCALDGAAGTACTSPKTYTGLAERTHTFTVYATVNKVKDPVPATVSWTVDATPPTAPTGLTAVASSPFAVQLGWVPATDNTGVTGYDLYRDGSLYRSLGALTAYTDTTVLGGQTHSYRLRARDIAGNVSPDSATVSATTPQPPPPVFADGFESGNLDAWSSTGGLTVQTATVHGGTEAVEGNTTNGTTYAKRTLPTTYTDGYARVWFDVLAQPDQVDLIRLRDASGNSLGYLYQETTGELGYHNDALGTNTLSATMPGPGWHALELHLGVDPAAGATGTVEVWLDGTAVADLSSTAIDVGTAPIAALQIGGVQGGLTYDVAFDDAAFGTGRLGPAADTTPPSTPTGVTAVATGPFQAQIGWDASTDDVAVAGYDVYRDGALVASVGTVPGWTDTTTLAGSAHEYAVRARDLSGNVSAPSDGVWVTQPPAAAPVFGDGFESGDVSAWTSSAGLTVEGTDVDFGAAAAEGATTAGATYAKKVLPGGYTDGYARTAFLVKSQGSQVTLLRLRDTPTGNGAYLYLTQSGKLAFRSDALTAGTVSSVTPGPGWHAVELHLTVSGAASVVETWLDGVAVPELTFGAIDLGTAAMGVLQIGDTATTAGLTWDVVFDGAAFGTSRLGPVGDVVPPSVPLIVNCAAASAFSVQIDWDAATDDTGVAGYQLFRNGTLLANLPVGQTSYLDGTVLAATGYLYAVRAVDSSGNLSAMSPPVPVTTPSAAPPVFADGFERGDLASWTTTANLTVTTASTRTGGYAVEGVMSTGNTYAKKTLPGTYGDAYARTGFLVKSSASAVNLLRLRDGSGASIGYVYLQTSGRLAFHNDTTGTNTLSAVAPGAGWHSVELHVVVAGAASLVEVWLDGAAVADLSGPVTLGANPVGALQVGETATQSWDVVFDDVAFGTSRLGVAADSTPPTVPSGVTAVASTPFAVQVGWDPSTDDTGVAGYDVLRDGTVIARLGNVTGYTDVAVAPGSTHSYVLAARDMTGNTSGVGTPAPVTLPAAGVPDFADGFETGDLSLWNSSGGLVANTTDPRTGAVAMEGSTTNGNTFAKKTLATTYTDVYLRVGYEVKSQASQVNLVRIRDGAGTSLGYLYLDTSGRLNLHADATNSNVTSTFVPGPGWHALEWHVVLNGAASTVEVWVDGVAVAALTGTGITLGAGPVGVFQIGETQTGRSYDALFDDVAVGSTRIGI